MPLYQQVVLLNPKASVNTLTGLFRKHARKVFELGGNIRAIENHGVRVLPEKTRTKFTTSDGSRTFWDARYVSAFIDISPKGLDGLDRLLKIEDAVIRHHTIRVPSAIDRCDSRRYNNPYWVPITPMKSTPEYKNMIEQSNFNKPA